jgi:hypothetical protein
MKVSPTEATIVYITIEYCLDDLFSGNGVLTRSQVHGLSTLGVRQHIIAARPVTALQQPLHPDDTPPGVQIHIVPVQTWSTTDRKSDHETFGAGVARILESLMEDEPLTAILAVDWTGMVGIHAMDPCVRKIVLARAPVFFLNFRVYSRMTNISKEDRTFYQTVERQAVRTALDSGGGVMGLCNSDREALRGMSMDEDYGAFRTILPMLRNEFASIAKRDRDVLLDDTRRRRRKYFVCLVRLAEDKGPQRFVDVCAEITKQDADFWTRYKVVPLLAGAASQPAFATALKGRFQNDVPGGIL